MSAQGVPGLGSLLANVTDEVGQDHVLGLNVPRHVQLPDCGLTTEAADPGTRPVLVTVGSNEGIQLFM